MTAKELRIGNYIHRPDLADGHTRTESVLAIYERVKTTGPINTIFDFSDISPIPLTPEWLERFGLSQNNTISKRYKYLNGLYKFSDGTWLGRGDSGYYLDTITHSHEDHETVVPVIKYVHQLQNLYFALTGEELEIKRATNRTG